MGAADAATGTDRKGMGGGVITIGYEPDGGHNPAGAVELVKWMADRFEGRAPVNDC